MRLSALGREAAATAWAAKVSSVLIAVVVASMCFVTLGTAGRNAALQNQVAARLQDAGSRLISVADPRATGLLTPTVISVTAGISTTEKVLALGPPTTVHNSFIGPTGTPVTSWTLVATDINHIATLVRGRQPRPGEAVVSATAGRLLGLEVPSGTIEDTTGGAHAVVGEFEAEAPFTDLNDGVLIIAPPGTGARELRVLVASVNEVTATERSLLQILSPPDIQEIDIRSPRGLADTARELGADLESSGYQLLLLILGGGGFFVAAVVLADVLIRQRDLGRRRTLGISRADLVTLVGLRALMCALPGAALGCLVAKIVGGSAAAPLDYAVATAVLAVLTAGIAALPAAAFASRRDPVAVMRTP